MLAAGFVPVGRTNMTEFAFSGLGINPHYGTPLSPWDRAAGRIPGGSSSGTAVAVADGMAVAGLGTDTGGSCRIPAAFCGVVGYKPTARRVPIAGRTAAGAKPRFGRPAGAQRRLLRGHRRGAGGRDARGARRRPRSPACGWRCRRTSVLDGLDATVATAFARALSVLEHAGARLVHTRGFRSSRRSWRSTPRAASRRPRPMPGTAHCWREKGALYDPRIRLRIARGDSMSAADYLDVVAARRRLIGGVRCTHARVRCVVMPTVPIVPPRVADLDDEREYNRVNLLILRNTAVGNFLDRCAISLPCHGAGEAPVGLMLMGETLGDARLFCIAAGSGGGAGERIGCKEHARSTTALVAYVVDFGGCQGWMDCAAFDITRAPCRQKKKTQRR